MVVVGVSAYLLGYDNGKWDYKRDADRWRGVMEAFECYSRPMIVDPEATCVADAVEVLRVRRYIDQA